jgi:glucokinase
MEKNMLNLFQGKVEILVSGLPKGNVAILGASALSWHEIHRNSKKL